MMIAGQVISDLSKVITLEPGDVVRIPHTFSTHSCPAVWNSPTLRYPGDRRGTFRMGICSKHIQYNRCIDAVFYQILCTGWYRLV